MKKVLCNFDKLQKYWGDPTVPYLISGEWRTDRVSEKEGESESACASE